MAGRVSRAESFASRLRGLMFRARISPDEGLYFPGTSSIHMLFMRFAIDCLFVTRPAADGSQRVVAVRQSLPPWRGVVWYVRGAYGVYELAPGTIERAGIAVGDVVRLEPMPVA